MLARLVLNSWPPSCLSLLNAEISGVSHHAQLLKTFSSSLCPLILIPAHVSKSSCSFLLLATCDSGPCLFCLPRHQSLSKCQAYSRVLEIVLGYAMNLAFTLIVYCYSLVCLLPSGSVWDLIPLFFFFFF